MIDYNIISISKVKVDKLSEFYRKVFKNRYKTLTNNWKWWYRSSYLGYEPIVMISDNKVIGQAGLIPIKIQIENKIIPATWFVDFAVLSDYQGQGLGKILTKEWMKICPNQITYCNDLSLRIFKKFGWDSSNNSKRLTRPLNPTKWIPLFNKLKLNIFNSLYNNLLKRKFSNTNFINPYSISDNYKTIFETFKKRAKVSQPTIYRDEDWLNWRLMDCPFKKNIYFFEYKENFAIIHIIRNKNIKRLHILYIYYLNHSEEEYLISLIVKWSLHNSIDLIWANSNNKNLIKNYEKSFSSRFTSSMNFAYRSSDEIIHANLQQGLNDSQAIDSDNDTISIDDNLL